MPITHFTVSTRVRTLATRALAVAAAVVGLTALIGGPVASQTPDVPPPRDYGDSGVRTGVVTVRAGSRWLPAGSAGSSGSSSCTTSSAKIIVEDDFIQPVNREWRVFGSDGSIPFTASPTDLPSSLPTYMRHYSPTGRWYAVTCDGVITVVAEGGPPVTVAGLTQQALDQLDPAEPELAVTPEALHFTQLQSWLAVEPAYWLADRRATAASGRVSVTAVATPTDVRWEMGDGETVTCAGPGTIWAPGLDEDDAECAYTYRETSVGQPGDAFEIATTVRFNVVVQATAPGSYGPFELERTAVEFVQVGEIQAVND